MKEILLKKLEDISSYNGLKKEHIDNIFSNADIKALYRADREINDEQFKEQYFIITERSFIDLQVSKREIFYISKELKIENFEKKYSITHKPNTEVILTKVKIKLWGEKETIELPIPKEATESQDYENFIKELTNRQ